jgi:hypothetical protein
MALIVTKEWKCGTSECSHFSQKVLTEEQQELGGLECLTVSFIRLSWNAMLLSESGHVCCTFLKLDILTLKTVPLLTLIEYVSHLLIGQVNIILFYYYILNKWGNSEN